MTLQPSQRPPRTASVAIALALLMCSGEAAAITVSEVPEPLQEDQTTLIAGRTDCESTASFTWGFADVTAGQAVEVWGSANTSANCSLVDERTGADASCMELTGAASVSDQSITMTVTVPELAAAVVAIDTSCVDSSAGSDTTHDVSVYFLVNPGSADVATGDFHTESVTLDFIGPDAPVLNTLGPSGSTTLAASYAPADGSNTPRTYELYCAEATDQGETADCAGAGLTAGEDPDSGVTNCTGEVSTTSGEATGLTLGIRYAVGVVAIDDFGNPSKLSNVLCAFPEPVDGIGDRLGEVDGFCSVAAPLGRSRGGAWPLALLGLAAGLGLRRRGGRSA